MAESPAVRLSIFSRQSSLVRWIRRMRPIAHHALVPGVSESTPLYTRSNSPNPYAPYTGTSVLGPPYGAICNMRLARRHRAPYDVYRMWKSPLRLWVRGTQVHFSWSAIVHRALERPRVVIHMSVEGREREAQSDCSSCGTLHANTCFNSIHHTHVPLIFIAINLPSRRCCVKID